MKNSLWVLAAVCLAASMLPAQNHSAEEARFKVSGNCGMCSARIEKAVKVDGVTYAKWKKSTKMLTVAYDPGMVTVDSLQRRVAAVGHDTERFKAPDSVYASLPDCCLYRDGAKSH